MEIFSEMLRSKEVFIALVTAVFTVIYAFAVKHFLLASRERRKEREKMLYESISKGMHAGTLESVEDFINVYKGVYDLSADDVSHRAGLARVLRQYITKIISDDSLAPIDAKKLKAFATAVLKRIEAESPFIELPAAERNLLLDIERFIKANDSANASVKLQDLAGLIEVRQEAMVRLQSSNKWSVPLAAVGLVLTIVFGIISIVK